MMYTSLTSTIYIERLQLSLYKTYTFNIYILYIRLYFRLRICLNKLSINK